MGDGLAGLGAGADFLLPTQAFVALADATRRAAVATAVVAAAVARGSPGVLSFALAFGFAPG